MLSMTGYGRGSARLGAGHVIVDVRTVNHRFLELRLHLAHELASQGASIEQCVREHVQRGRIDVNARLEGPPSAAIDLDANRARAAFGALRELRDQLAPGEPVPLSLLSTLPGLFREAPGADDERTAASVQATEQACRELLTMRRAEGARLESDLRARCTQIVARLDELTPILPRLVAEQQQKLRGRIQQLISGGGLQLDSSRLEHEVALIADRADVSEELTRLRAHAAAVDHLLTGAPEEAVGHRIDFLLQEMSREANTTAAKLPDAGATHNVLEVKSELLRMREQVQNVL
jgi:uncharacterized protein (TIGR00255 family)